MHTRRAQRAILKKKLSAQVNIHMPAPRRIGKTWTINRLAEDLRGEDWLVIELDVQGMSDPEQFARSLCQTIQKQLPPTSIFNASLKQRFKNMIDGNWGTNLEDALGRLAPMAFMKALIEALSQEGKKSAILIDEIAYFALAFAETNPKQAKDFFYQLRSLQLEHRQVRWLATGSIGLNVVAARFGMEGAFVDLETFILDPFTEEEARSFLRDEAIQKTFNYRFDADDETLDIVFTELGWLAPYYLKLVANEVRPSGAPLGFAVEGVHTATESDFERAIEKLLEPNRKSDFAVWTEHIDKNFPKPDQEIAGKVLDRLSQEATGETLDTLLASMTQTTKKRLRDVLALLEIDGLVQKVQGRYRFRSGLIRRYWKEYEAE